LDELCQLVRSAVTADATCLARELTRHIREQQRPIRLWSAADTDAQLQAIAAYQEAVHSSIDAPLEQLQQQGAEPWDASVQAVMHRHQQLLAQHRVRDITVQRLTSPATDADPVLADLQQQLRADILRKLKQRPTEGTDLLASHWTTNPFLIGFFSRAELHSEQCRQIDVLLVDCKKQLQLHPDPTAREAPALARRLRRLCCRYQLGDAFTFARWAALVRPAPADMSDVEDKACWIFLISALRCLRPPTSHPPADRQIQAQPD
jgi:hypothetical protein